LQPWRLLRLVQQTRVDAHRHAALPLHRKGIVHGMLWHEILSEPASLRRRARGRRKKLLS